MPPSMSPGEASFACHHYEQSGPTFHTADPNPAHRTLHRTSVTSSSQRNSDMPTYFYQQPDSNDEARDHKAITMEHDIARQTCSRSLQKNAHQEYLQPIQHKSILLRDFEHNNNESSPLNQLRSSKVTYDDLNARFMAADEERTRVSHLMTAKLDEERRDMSSLMTARLLAEAESQELFARRLRESVARVRQPGSLSRFDAIATTSQQDGVDMAIELAASTPITDTASVSGVSEETIQADVTPASPLQHIRDRYEPVNSTDSIEDTLSNKNLLWRPHAISQLTPLPVAIPSSDHHERFSWEELHLQLGGAQYSPGLYFTCNDSEQRILQGRTYWLLESQYEPFAPLSPGQHGAKLTAFFNDSLTTDGIALNEEDYRNTPVFVCLHEGEGYTYLGQYSQERYSDTLSHSELFQQVPDHVLKYWAAQLADSHRPAWITDKLAAHFWPPPVYNGPIPSDSAVTTPHTSMTEPRDSEKPLEKRVQRALERYAIELRDWKKDSQLRVKLLTEQALMDMWSKSDMDEEKGLRLWWEYLQCIGYDEGFYNRLVSAKKDQKQLANRNTRQSNKAVPKDGSKRSSGQNSSVADGKHRHDSVTASSTVKEGRSTRTNARPIVTAGERGVAAKASLHLKHMYPEADLQAACQMHDDATKAVNRKRGRDAKAR